jgi:hypothetical protein
MFDPYDAPRSPADNWPMCPLHDVRLRLESEPAYNSAGHRTVWTCSECDKAVRPTPDITISLNQPVKGNYGFRDPAP